MKRVITRILVFLLVTSNFSFVIASDDSGMTSSGDTCPLWVSNLIKSAKAGSTPPVVTPPAGGTTQPPVVIPKGKDTTPPVVTPPAGGTTQPPVVIPKGKDTTPPVVTPPAGGTTQPPVVIPKDKGTPPPVVTPPAGGTTQPIGRGTTQPPSTRPGSSHKDDTDKDDTDKDEKANEDMDDLTKEILKDAIDSGISLLVTGLVVLVVVLIIKKVKAARDAAVQKADELAKDQGEQAEEVVKLRATASRFDKLANGIETFKSAVIEMLPKIFKVGLKSAIRKENLNKIVEEGVERAAQQADLSEGETATLRTVAKNVTESGSAFLEGFDVNKIKAMTSEQKQEFFSKQARELINTAKNTAQTAGQTIGLEGSTLPEISSGDLFKSFKDAVNTQLAVDQGRLQQTIELQAQALRQASGDTSLKIQSELDKLKTDLQQVKNQQAEIARASTVQGLSDILRTTDIPTEGEGSGGEEGEGSGREEVGSGEQRGETGRFEATKHLTADFT
jgi:hypothetical protein